MKVHLIECSEEACVKTKDCSTLIMACGSTMVEQLLHHTKVKGSSPIAANGSGREKIV